MKCIGFAFNPTADTALELRDRALEWCSANGIEAWALPSDEAPDDMAVLSRTETIVVLGGDGTFLRAAQMAVDGGVPILGVNVGRIGFLSKVEHSALEGVLRHLADGEFELEPRLMLEAQVVHADGSGAGWVYSALNEAAVVRGRHARVMRVVVDVGDSRVATYVCDGVVVASPTGSTGYSFSAGGPIVEPTSHNLVVTPIAAYLTPLRSSVVGAQHVVSVTVKAAYDCLVSIDGREDVSLDIGDRVDIRARDKPISFVQPRGATRFWDLLRQKATLLPDG